jgi:hypothetical protein
VEIKKARKVVSPPRLCLKTIDLETKLFHSNNNGSHKITLLPIFFRRFGVLIMAIRTAITSRQYNPQNVYSKPCNPSDQTGNHLFHKEIHNFIPVFQCADDRRLSELDIEAILPNHPQRNDQIIEFPQIVGFKYSQEIHIR